MVRVFLVFLFFINLMAPLESEARIRGRKHRRKAAAARDTRPEELRGSEALRLRQNTLADEAGWQRMEDLSVLGEHIAKKLLVRVPDGTQAYYLDGISPELRYLRPGAEGLLESISRAHYDAFRKRLKITSLVETVRSKIAQHSKTRVTPYGKMRSVHLTGSAFDISIKPMDRQERLWMRKLLVSWAAAGLLDATEELYGNCFHIFVLPPGSVAGK